MDDILLKIGKGSFVGGLLKQTGLPMPQKLKRFKPEWPKYLLNNKKIVIGGSDALHGEFANAILANGGEVFVDSKHVKHYKDASELYARPALSHSKLKTDDRINGIIFNAVGLNKIIDLKDFFSFMQSNLARLASCARVVIIAELLENQSVETSAVQRSFEGFIRSFGKESGGNGITINLIYLQKGGESNIGGPLVYFLSDASTFVDGQSLTVKKPKKQSLVEEAYSLEGKTALVTGAARGIGKAIAETLAARGAHVICLDRPEDDPPLFNVALKIDGSILLQDVSTSDAAEKIAAYIKEKHGGVDIVVHNAGVTRDKTFKKMSNEKWNQAIAVNLEAPIRISKALLQEGLNDLGRIICLSSIAAIAGNFGQTNYSTAKAGLIGLVQALSLETASRGITVNAVAPGFIETRMTSAIPLLTKEAGRRLSMLGQGGLPQDIANTITFLTTAEMQGVSGQLLRVCGGSFLGA